MHEFREASDWSESNVITKSHDPAPFYFDKPQVDDAYPPDLDLLTNNLKSERIVAAYGAKPSYIVRGDIAKSKKNHMKW